MKVTHHPPLPKGPQSRLGGVHNKPQQPAQGTKSPDDDPALASKMAAMIQSATGAGGMGVS